jgi:hypothetical protein
MRTRLQTLLPSVLALTLVTLLVAPLVSLASSGLPATMSMYPETAGPGSTVEISGIDFPAERVVEVQLSTPDGTVPLTTITTSPSGDFRQVVALPIEASDGVWELQAIAADGTTSAYAFATALDAAAVVVAAETVPSVVPAGNSSGDIALMLIVAVVLGAVAFGGLFVYRQIKDESPPGMGKGDDLIWGSGVAVAGPEQTATEEPHWEAANTET